MVAADIKRLFLKLSSDDDENFIDVDELRVSLNVKDGSDLESDTDGTLGVPFTELLENAGLIDVEWDGYTLRFSIPRGHDIFLDLVRDIEAGKHGPDMVRALHSFHRDGTTDYPSTNPADKEYWVY